MELAYGINQSYYQYKRQILHKSQLIAKDISSLSIFQLVALLETGARDEAELIFDKLWVQWNSEIVKKLFTLPHLSIFVYSHIYTLPVVDFSGLLLYYITSSDMVQAEDGTISNDLVTKCDIENLAIVKAFAFLSNRYPIEELSLASLRASDMANLAICMGCKRNSNKIKPILYELGDSDPKGERIEIGKLVARLDLINDGQWWNVVSQMDPRMFTETKELVTQVMCACLDPNKTSSCLCGWVGLLQKIMLIVSFDNIRTCNPRTTEIVESLEERIECALEQQNGDCCEDSFESKALENYAPADGSSENVKEPPYANYTRESMKLFVALDWWLDPTILSSDAQSEIMGYITESPQIAYEMLPTVAKLMFTYICQAPQGTFGWDNIEEINEKLHSTESLLSLMLYGAKECNTWYQSQLSESGAIRERITQFTDMYFPFCLQMTDTILGKEPVAVYMIQMFVSGNSFVTANRAALMSKLTADIERELLTLSLIPKELYNDMLRVLQTFPSDHIHTNRIIDKDATVSSYILAEHGSFAPAGTTVTHLRNVIRGEKAASTSTTSTEPEESTSDSSPASQTLISAPSRWKMKK